MFNLDRDGDTVCAVSTPPGVGGIAVIRLSGEKALSIGLNNCPFLPKNPESHRVYYGFFVDPKTQEKIDEVLVTYFAKGRSFTGEETLEISCHGGALISSLILKELVNSGARIAEKGEFTYRAFMQGRIDLVQAESILQVIESQSKQALNLSLRQLEGGLSEEIKSIEDKLTLLLANLEANIDFSSEDIEIADKKSLLNLGEESLEKIKGLLKSYDQGRLIKEGLKVGLVGEPNVGKSSLLNGFSKEDVAIVTDVPGTTRDFVQSSIQLGGHKIQFVDTAGLRPTEDKVESIGIERTLKAIEKLDVLMLIFDLSKPLKIDASEQIRQFNPQKTIILGNKSDLLDPKKGGFELKKGLFEANFELKNWLESIPDAHFKQVSALDRETLIPVEALLESFVRGDFSENAATISQARHFELLKHMEECIIRSLQLITTEESPELIAFEMQDALKDLHEILGKEFDDQVMDRVFSEFCLGK